MKCGLCGEPMEKGRLEVHGTVMGFLTFGFSSQHLFWYDWNRTAASRREVIHSNDARVAFRCVACNVMSVDTKTAGAWEQGRRRRRTRRADLADRILRRT